MLRDRFREITDRAAERFTPTKGLQAPSLEDIQIGSAKELRAAVLFLDICSFSRFTSAPTVDVMKRALLALNTLIPTLMSVVYDHGGYVEKNTGDGLMAVIGAGETDPVASEATLTTIRTMQYVMREMVTPHLESNGINGLQIRLTADLGPLLLARIGLPKGSADHQRSFLTAVGPCANLASKMAETQCGPDQVLVGDLIKSHAPGFRHAFFANVTPIDWEWTYAGTASRYSIWRYTEGRSDLGDGYIGFPGLFALQRTAVLGG